MKINIEIEEFTTFNCDEKKWIDSMESYLIIEVINDDGGTKYVRTGKLALKQSRDIIKFMRHICEQDKEKK